MTKNNKKNRADSSAPAVPGKTRERVLADLNTSLAHALDLAAAAKQAHWNIEGPNFEGLHGLFDKIASLARDTADELAERARALDGMPAGVIQDTVAATTFEKFPNDETAWSKLGRLVHARVIGLANQLRESLEIVADDPVTEDLYIGMIAELEKTAWMLNAHLR